MVGDRRRLHILSQFLRINDLFSIIFETEISWKSQAKLLVQTRSYFNLLINSATSPLLTFLTKKSVHCLENRFKLSVNIWKFLNEINIMQCFK